MGTMALENILHEKTMLKQKNILNGLVCLLDVMIKNIKVSNLHILDVVYLMIFSKFCRMVFTL